MIYIKNILNFINNKIFEFVEFTHLSIWPDDLIIRYYANMFKKRKEASASLLNAELFDVGQYVIYVVHI